MKLGGLQIPLKPATHPSSFPLLPDRGKFTQAETGGLFGSVQKTVNFKRIHPSRENHEPFLFQVVVSCAAARILLE